MSIEESCFALYISFKIGNMIVGGFSSNTSWKTNLLSGIIELIYSPRICSLPIHPNKSTFFNQLCNTFIVKSGLKLAITDVWNPSSQRKALGKISLEGVRE